MPSAEGCSRATFDEGGGEGGPPQLSSFAPPPRSGGPRSDARAPLRLGSPFLAEKLGFQCEGGWIWTRLGLGRPKCKEYLREPYPDTVGGPHATGSGFTAQESELKVRALGT